MESWKQKVADAKRLFGPGVITGSADDDPSGIGTYSVAGAQFGYGLLWLTPLCLPLMIAVQEMCGRLGVVTGAGLATAMKRHYSKWVLIPVVSLLIVANLFNIYADLNVMAASLKMLLGGSLATWLTVIVVGTVALMIGVPYRWYVSILKYLCLSLLAYAVVALLPSVHNDWHSILYHTFVPFWQSSAAFILTVVGYFGTTISPYLFFWQASEEVEEEILQGTAKEGGGREVAATPKEFRALRWDTTIGMIFSQAITFFIVISTAATLHALGKTDINTAQDAAVALLPLGKIAYFLFTLGIIGTGLLAIPTLAGSVAYAVAETAGWKYGLSKKFSEAKAFYIVLAAMVAVAYLFNFVGTISPLKGLLYSAALNGVVAPPLMVVLLMICNNGNIVGAARNGKASNLFGGLAVAVMGVAAAILMWSLATGTA